MSSKIFLARSTPADFEATVRSAVETDEYPEMPEQVTGLESIRIFGAPESRADTFEKMTAGDLVAFHQDGEYVGVGRIGTTFEDDNEWATTTVWNDISTSLIYTVEDFTPVAVPSAALHRIFGYADGYSPPALMRVAANRVTNRPEAIKAALEQYTDKHS